MSKVAIIGRPNVGKSTIFNRLVGRKLALVDDQPGVTRDRREGEGRIADLAFTVIDTAGLEEGDPETLAGRMRAQTETALSDCDVIVFVIDARAGVTGTDRHFAAAIRRAGKPIIVLANKAESGAGRDGAYEAFSLGLGDPIPFSAEHGQGLGDLYDALVDALPASARLDPDEEDEGAPLVLGEEEDGSELDATKPLRIAVLGRPNAGKSTLLNRILGEDRLLTGPEPGITRDSIAIETEWRGRKLKLFDTAGLRRRSRVVEKVEKLAVADALRAVRFAEVVVLLLDATIPFEKQDLSLADLVEQEGRALVIGLNKWDLIDNKSDRARELREEADRLLPQLRGTRVVPVSGLTGAHVDKLLEEVVATHAIWNTRISTGRLNRWLGPVVDSTPPPAVSGRRIKIRYMTQPKARPPFFVLFGNSVESIPESYKRYLVNGLRETFGLIGVPIRLSMRSGGANPYAPKKRR
ncbi:GTP-binding protein [Roseiarcus fermentans]|uniref:GTPase Der n=1 Tax=Roseiarcus fermentans TaxID=1473586 RepID=A0A366FJU9_9HYPH|nr:ribosome biogenesis GTPase Der [Roseiarcus fermentans]RBP14386.1 GTP-binding protein [Roseiarcus fermentans]